MPDELQAREVLYRLVRANSPFVVPRQRGVPEPVSLEAATAQAWPAGGRTMFFGDELVSTVPTVPAWAVFRVRHTEREAISMNRRVFDVRGTVEVVVHTPHGRLNSEFIGAVLADKLARVLDPTDRPPRFADGTPLYLLGSRTEQLPTEQLGKWHRFAVASGFRYEEGP